VDLYSGRVRHLRRIPGAPRAAALKRWQRSATVDQLGILSFGGPGPAEHWVSRALGGGSKLYDLVIVGCHGG
jgi:hypothetical protein